jgi:carbonic anhydrase/acetyltransferase-like protein (isoleucine patch superfamily)
VTKYTDRLVPSTRFVAVEGVGAPVVNEMSFVAPSASLIGNVTLGKESR